MTTIKELKELDAKATSAPWYGFNATFSRETMRAFSVISNDESGSNVATYDDYELITATRNALPELIRVIELAEDGLEKAQATLRLHRLYDLEKVEKALSEIRKLKGEKNDQ